MENESKKKIWSLILTIVKYAVTAALGALGASNL